MSVLNLLPAAVGQSGSTQVYGELSTSAKAPQDFTDPIYVVIPDWNTSFLFRIDAWPALYGGTLPTAGTEVMLEYDNNDNLRCTWWNGTYTAPESSSSGQLLASNNLSDLDSVAAALANLGYPFPGIQLAKAYSSSSYPVGVTTLTAMDSTNLTVSVVVPPSGDFVVRLQSSGGVITGGATSHYMTWGLLKHGTSTVVGDTNNAITVDSSSLDGYGRSTSVISMEIDVTGQTPGATLQLDFAVEVDSGSTSNGYVYGPVKMKVYAT